MNLKDYAKAKNISIGFLEKECGITEIPMGIAMPYKDEEGKVHAVRIRKCLEKGQVDTRFLWESGSKLCLYGLWRLKLYVKERIFIVEGESDAQTLWTAGIPAVGLPGSSTWNDDRDAVHLDRYERIYVVDEQDSGAEALLKSLKKSRLAKKIYVIRFKGYKDVSEAWLNSFMFSEELDQAVKAAKPLYPEFLEQMDKAAAELMESEPEPEEPKTPFITYAALRKRPIVREWLVQGFLLNRPQLVEIFGDPSTGKSLIALDLALSIAAGESWAGNPVPMPGLTVYLAGEGYGEDLSIACNTWAKHRNLEDINDEDVYFVAKEGTANLGGHRGDDASALADWIQVEADAKGKPKLIVVDTLSANMVGDENDAKDMSAFIKSVRQNFVERFSCTTIVIHHPGHQHKERSKGSTTWNGTIDAQFRVKRDEDDLVRFELGTKIRGYKGRSNIIFKEIIYNFTNETRTSDYTGVVLDVVGDDEFIDIKRERLEEETPVTNTDRLLAIVMDAGGIISREQASTEFCGTEKPDRTWQNQFKKALQNLTTFNKVKYDKENNIIQRVTV